MEVLVIQERGKNGVPGEKPSKQGENQQLNALVTPGENDLEPVSHWQETRALTTARRRALSPLRRPCSPFSAGLKLTKFNSVYELL